jgi:hypothetical protein
MRRSLPVLLAPLILLAACGRTDEYEQRHAARPDTSVADASAADAGSRDAGPRDAGLPDAGARDAGLPDAAAPDAAAPAPLCAPGTPPVQLAGTGGSALALALDDDNVYWTQMNALKMVSKRGGPQTLLASPTLSAGVAVDDEAIYWTERDEGLVRKMLKADRVPVTLWTADPADWTAAWPMDVAVDQSHVYWYTRRTVWKLAKAGGAAAVVFSSGTGSPVQIQGLALDSTDVWWIGWALFETPAGRLMRAPKGGGAVVSLDISDSGPEALTLDDDFAYFASGQVPGSIRRIAKSAGAVATLVTGQDYSFSIAVDADHVYWSSDEFIRKARKDGAGLVELASGQREADTVAVDASCVYWSAVSGVMRMAK